MKNNKLLNDFWFKIAGILYIIYVMRLIAFEFGESLALFIKG